MAIRDRIVRQHRKRLEVAQVKIKAKIRECPFNKVKIF